MEKDIQFLIRRRDTDRIVDDLIVKSLELRIGQRSDNHLVLNDPAVSPVHALVSRKKGVLWLVDILDLNATLLNGTSISEARLPDRAIIQIGPFFLLVEITPSAVVIEVQRQLKVFPVRKRALALSAGAATQGRDAHRAAPNAKDKAALSLHWSLKRHEIAGPAPSAKSALQSVAQDNVGRLGALWRPTSDLNPVRRWVYIGVSFLAAAILVMLGLIWHRTAFTPGPLSKAHQSVASSRQDIAIAACANACANCHGLSGTMQERCTACHEMAAGPTRVMGGFSPSISAAHRRAGVGCAGCHSEHSGESPRPKLVDNLECTSCHNDRYEYGGKILGTPHKGPSGSPTVGYIRNGDQVGWKGSTGAAALVQFHTDHPYAHTKCGYCHQSNFEPMTQGWRESPRAACAACHVTSFAVAEPIQSGPNCATCHKQHGEGKDLRVSLQDINEVRLREIIAQVRGGGLQVLKDETEAFTPAAVGGQRVRRQGEFTFGGRLVTSPFDKSWDAWPTVFGIIFVSLLAAGAFKYSSAKFIRAVVDPLDRRRVAGATDRSAPQPSHPGGRPGVAAFPHPKIDPDLCIGCYACIEACPQSVLTMGYDYIATPIALNLCMDDTSCQTACPTGALEVINTQKTISQRKKPKRDEKNYMTNVPGIYSIGYVSRVPLIQNAIREGDEVLQHIEKDLDASSRAGGACEVAIIGAGAAGLSAAIAASVKGIQYVLIDQGSALATIESYPEGKHVTFHPKGTERQAPLAAALSEAKRELSKELVLQRWKKVLQDYRIEVQQNEICTEIKRGADCFNISTRRGDEGQSRCYTARRVILAMGSGMPRPLRVPGEELEIPLRSGAVICPSCSSTGPADASSCAFCGKPRVQTQAPHVESKVKYQLWDPDAYQDKKCLVVGAGNSAIEAAVRLAGFKKENREVKFSGSNEVTLIVRNDFKQDLTLTNKMALYDCLDAKRIKLYSGVEVQEIKGNEVVLKKGSRENYLTVANDYVFALIGLEWPEQFLKSMGIEIIGG